MDQQVQQSQEGRLVLTPFNLTCMFVRIYNVMTHKSLATSIPKVLLYMHFDV